MSSNNLTWWLACCRHFAAPQGDTLDLSLASKEDAPGWSGCLRCGAGRYGLWADGRPHLASAALDVDGYLAAMAALGQVRVGWGGQVRVGWEGR